MSLIAKLANILCLGIKTKIVIVNKVILKIIHRIATNVMKNVKPVSITIIIA